MRNLLFFGLGVAVTVAFFGIQQPKPQSAPFTSRELIQADYDLLIKNVSSLFARGSSAEEVTNTRQLATIFIITPTYDRSSQLADLTRFAQTLRLVPAICWMVIEDSAVKSRQVARLLARSRVPYVHLNIKLNRKYSSSGRGAENRNLALDWLRSQYGSYGQNAPQGVIYFADDDNAYDVRLFEEIRSTRRVSVFPVGHIAVYGVSTPIVNRTTGHVTDFHDCYCHPYGRTFCVDMAGFAINLKYFLDHPKARMEHENGRHEESIVAALGIAVQELEPKAWNCTEVLVWHVRTETGVRMNVTHIRMYPGYEDTNLPELYRKSI